MMKQNILIFAAMSVSVSVFGQLAQRRGGALPQAAAPEVSVRSELAQPREAQGSVVFSYDYPEGLSCLGTHPRDESPVCNYLSPNSLVNGKHFLWAPQGKKVKYECPGPSVAVGFSWTLPGTAEKTAVGRAAAATYTAPGVYPFPELVAYDADGGRLSYRADGELLVGGVAEITTANCRKWGETYRLGSYPLSGGAGSIGGTNSAGMDGYGNLFMTSQAGAHITGVNVYFVAKPARYEAGQQLLLRVWYPSEGSDGNMVLNGLPLEVAYLPVADIREARPGECSARGAAVGEFRFDSPLQIWDKPLFFVTVEGFGSDLSKADIRMLTEVDGQPMAEEQASGLLAHNSFVSYKGYGYTIPVNYFGTPLGASFMICPVIDNGDGFSAGMADAVGAASPATRFKAAGLRLSVERADGVEARLADLSGAVVAVAPMVGGRATLNAPRRGLYLLRVVCRGGGSSVAKVVL